MWAPQDRVTAIKKKLFEEGCAISEEGQCDANLLSAEACSTAHCKATYDDWESSDELYALWSYVLEAHETGELDYDACIGALGGEYD